MCSEKAWMRKWCGTMKFGLYFSSLLIKVDLSHVHKTSMKSFFMYEGYPSNTSTSGNRRLNGDLSPIAWSGRCREYRGSSSGSTRFATSAFGRPTRRVLVGPTTEADLIVLFPLICRSNADGCRCSSTSRSFADRLHRHPDQKPMLSYIPRS